MQFKAQTMLQVFSVVAMGWDWVSSCCNLILTCCGSRNSRCVRRTGGMVTPKEIQNYLTKILSQCQLVPHCSHFDYPLGYLLYGEKPATSILNIDWFNRTELLLSSAYNLLAEQKKSPFYIHRRISATRSLKHSLWILSRESWHLKIYIKTLALDSIKKILTF